MSTSTTQECGTLALKRTITMVWSTAKTCTITMFAVLAAYRLQRVATQKCGIPGAEAYDYDGVAHCDHMYHYDFAVLAAYRWQRVVSE